MSARFNIYRFYNTGHAERVQHEIAAADVAATMRALIGSMSARMGVTRSIVITDHHGQKVFIWTHPTGQTYPPAPPARTPHELG